MSGRGAILRVLVVVLVAQLAASCVRMVQPQPTATQASPRVFQGDLAYEHVLAQCDIGPRPIGSKGNQEARELIVEHLANAGWSVEVQSFTHRGQPVGNVLARLPQDASDEAPVILGAHFDTRPVADRDPEHPDQPVPGANDGASGVAVLLELARSLDLESIPHPVWLAFFDAEDKGQIDGWDWSVGAEYMAEHLTLQPEAVIVVDMIGDADQQIYMEQNSDPELRAQIWDVAASLGYSTFIPEEKWNMVDDHLPFRDRGIPVVLLIDFDYPYWHTVQDTADKVSAESLERVGRVLERWLEGE